MSMDQPVLDVVTAETRMLRMSYLTALWSRIETGMSENKKQAV